MERQEELCVEVNKRAHLFLESGKLTDCKFVVGAKPHQVVVGAHMLVMALASPVFEAMFYGSLAETREYIPIVDAELDIFKAMLRYIYTSIVKLSSCDEAIQLYYVANKYMLHQLMKQCSSYLQSNVNLGNVCQLYEHSQLYQDEALTQKCTYIFTENTKELLQDSSFKDAALGTVEYIFSLNELNIDNEVDLINAAALYLSAHDDKVVENKTSSPGIHTAPPEKVLNVEDNVKGVSEAQNATDGAEQETPGSSLMINDTLKQQIRSVVRHIRLLTLTPQQYADCTARSSLLTPAEDLAVILNIAATNKSSVAMPSGLSTCRVLRDKAGKARSEATFRHTVRNLSSSVWEWSAVFYVRNLPWEIEVWSGDVGGTEYMGVGVCCNRGSKSTNWSCAANVEVRLICHKPGAENIVKKYQRLFNKEDYSCGFRDFLPWTTVLDPTRGYIQDGAVTLEVHVAAEEPQGPLTLTEPQWLRRLAGRLGAPVSVRVLPTQPTKRDLSDQTRQQVLFQADTLQIYACAQVFTPLVPNTYIQKLRPANRSLVQNDTDNEINMTEIVNALNGVKLGKGYIVK